MHKGKYHVVLSGLNCVVNISLLKLLKSYRVASMAFHIENCTAVKEISGIFEVKL